MASPATEISRPLALVWGDDEFSVKKRARQIYDQWCQQSGSLDHEVIDGSAANTGEVFKILKQLNEALDSLPFFGSTKVVWLQNCNFLGEERTATSQAVTERLALLADTWKNYEWRSTRLLISAAKIDRRRVFYKTLEKIGHVESLLAWSTADRDWAEKAEAWVHLELRPRKKTMSAEAAADLVARIGPNTRQLSNELEKLALFVGTRGQIELADVDTMAPRQKSAEAFALADALGDRTLPRALQALDEELWEMRADSQKSPLGLLYGLISKIRVLILLKELMRAGYLKPESDYSRFKSQLERVPTNALPADKRFNPLALHPYILFKTQAQTRRYSLPELIRAMDILLETNRKLVSSGLDEAVVLQQAIVQVMQPAAPGPVTAKPIS
jgi:DNA polymerase III subunit delta